ncbi:MFS transporter [Cellulomonas denverensis]|uniref:Nucleoside permease n=1 Tax=Cellulomonas denverensis TaxID=264297 RepID=A0A7X6KYI3_9CELL|nr:MFS transporter [Cellulomonas denverensis]NKY24452.1 nucleoside permease [Cellulomonas denverensis]
MGIRLVAMMLLEFVVFGSWFATFGLVLASNGLPTIIGTAYTLAAVAAIVSPMFLGALGDRFFSSHRVLGAAHLLGGALMFLLPGVVTSGNGTLVLALIFGYMLLFQPTLGLANSIAFRHLGANGRLFPYIRVFGTLGWAAAGLLVGALGLSASPNLFLVTAIASLVLGVYAFTLPATPPPAKGAKFSLGDVIGAQALKLFRHRNFVVFFVCVLLTAVSLGVYNSFAATYLGALGIENVAGVLALGQLSEVVFILTIPWVIKHLGTKWALFGGMVMWGVRFALFALAAANGGAWIAVVAICLHGICNDFFLVVGAMYIDQVAPLEIQSQAQNLLILAVSGIGAFIGSFVSGEVYGRAIAPHEATLGAAAWTPLWWIPIGAAVLTAILWIGFFRYDRHVGVERWSADVPAPALAAS